MPNSRPYPNFDKTKMSSIRKKIDAIFIDKMRDLEDAYYGPAVRWDSEGTVIRNGREGGGWSHGVTRQFKLGKIIYNKLENVALSKQQFDNLHAAIWEMHSLAIFEQNEKDGNPYNSKSATHRWIEDPDDPENKRIRVRHDAKKEKAKKIKRRNKEQGIDASELIPRGLEKRIKKTLGK